MSHTSKMHADEVDTDPSLVRRLLSAQFPQWASLSIERVKSSGTDNAIYRIGDEMAARMPRTPGAALQVDKEFRWLSKLAPGLPLAIPAPVVKGEPGEGYPWHWSISRWLPGEEATFERLADPVQSAIELAGFVAALHEIDPAGGPSPGAHNFFRGNPLSARDGETRAAIASLGNVIDTESVTAMWERALQASMWDLPAVWVHGDLASGNLLAVNGRLSGVIDFGGLGVGDPACDLMVAWNLFRGGSRDAFRSALPVSDAMWQRGCGWALCVALLQIPYYRGSNPGLAATARRTIDEILADGTLG